MANYYGLGSPTAIEVNKSVDEDLLQNVAIYMNDIQLSKGVFDGNYFQGRSLTLSSAPLNGKQVAGWKVIVINGGQTQEQDYDGATCSMEMPTCSRLIVRARIEDHDGIEEATANSWQWRKDGDKLTLSGLRDDQPVSVYNLQGMLLGTYSPQQGALRINLPQSGVYIIKTNNRQIKIKR